jgi:hypothetical protein
MIAPATARQSVVSRLANHHHSKRRRTSPLAQGD